MGDYRALEPWVVDSFSIEAGPNGTYDELFANGLMQARVTISLTAHRHDPDTGDDCPYTLWPHDFLTFELQLEGGRPFPSGWAGAADKGNIFVAWLTTTKAETQTFRARILQGNGEWATTEGGGNSSVVTIKATPAVEYTPGELKIEQNSASGRWRQYWHEDLDNPKEHTWHATNYYVYPGVYQLQKAEVYWGHESPSSRRVFDIAEEDGYTVVTAGWYLNDQIDGHIQYWTRIEGWTYDMTANLKVNERAGVPSFTHVRFDGSAPGRSQSFQPGDVWFHFWDIYGNQGKFYPRVSGDRNGIEFHVKS